MYNSLTGMFTYHALKPLKLFKNFLDIKLFFPAILLQFENQINIETSL